ncbi:MAG TPA: Arm DNA-binding domain-containing protein, partial [Burkholderiaceae bacterium]
MKQAISATRRRAALTDTAVKNARPQQAATKLPDSKGLFLLVQPNGAKLWRYRFWLNEKEGLLALGSYPEISLSNARERHAAARKLVANGINPVHEQVRQKAEVDQKRLQAIHGSFDAVCRSWRQLTDPELRETSIRQRQREIDNDLLPQLKLRPVESITRL